MNRIIVDLLADFMGAIALAIVIAGSVLGYRYGIDAGANLTASTGFGLVLGIVTAIVLCGLLSALVLIENHLRFIADDIDDMREATIGTEGDLDNEEAAREALERGEGA